MTKSLEKPDWAKVGEKTQELVNRTLVLWELQRRGKINLRKGDKSKLAEFFGVGRMALDRAIAAAVNAQDDVDSMLRHLDPNYVLMQTEIVSSTRDLYPSHDEPDRFLDEDQYNQVLHLAGIEE